MSGMPSNMMNMVEQIKRFKGLLKGNPHEELQNLLNSGQVPQGMLNQAQEAAKPIYEAMKDLL